MKPTSHKYGFWAKTSRFSGPILTIGSLCFGTYYFSVGILTLGNISRYGYTPFLNSIVFLIVYGLVAYWGIEGYMLGTDINTDSEGLHIQVFTKTITIKWTEIVEVKPVILYGFIERPKTNKKIVITKSRLPFVFRITGMLQGKTFRPSLRINPSISDYSVLIKRISKAAGQNQRLKKKSHKVEKSNN